MSLTQESLQQQQQQQDETGANNTSAFSSLPKPLRPTTLEEEQIPSLPVPTGGAIVVVAKCPVSGVAKTRLSSLFGTEGSAVFARAMLSDVLVAISHCTSLRNILKILLYAPGNEEGEGHMMSLLDTLHLPYNSSISGGATTDNRSLQGQEDDEEGTLSTMATWILLPMMLGASKGDDSGAEKDLQSSDLGTKLADGLIRTRAILSEKANDRGEQVNSEVQESMSSVARDGVDLQHDDSNWSTASVCGSEEDQAMSRLRSQYSDGGVVFLGMDSPELPLEEIVHALNLSMPAPRRSEYRSTGEGGVGIGVNNATARGRAFLCPADDGGYGMLCVPPHAPSSVFEGVRWSDPLTAISQLKVLSDHGIDVTLGRLTHDVDEPDDVLKLAERLCRTRSDGVETGVANRESSGKIPNNDALERSSYHANARGSLNSTFLCNHTWAALLQFFLVEEHKQGRGEKRQFRVNPDRWKR